MSWLHTKKLTPIYHSHVTFYALCLEYSFVQSVKTVTSIYIDIYISIFWGHIILQSLSGAYEILHRSYSKVVDVMQSGKRLLGKYFRVAFYGQVSLSILISFLFYLSENIWLHLNFCNFSATLLYPWEQVPCILLILSGWLTLSAQGLSLDLSIWRLSPTKKN